MADCPSNNSDCLPAGSNTNDPCSPCFEPTKESFLQDLATLARQVCAVGNQVKSWNQRLARFTNRMDRLERDLRNLPDEEDALLGGDPCTNLDNTEVANAILVCHEGVTHGFTPLEEECSDILGNADGIWNVVPHGLRWFPITPVQNLFSSFSSQSTSNLSGYDDVLAEQQGCGIWALCEVQDFLTSTSSLTDGTTVATLNGVICGTEYVLNGGADSIGGICIFPLTSKLITLSVANSYSGGFTHSSSIVRLRGYFA